MQMLEERARSQQRVSLAVSKTRARRQSWSAAFSQSIIFNGVTRGERVLAGINLKEEQRTFRVVCEGGGGECSQHV